MFEKSFKIVIGRYVTCRNADKSQADMWFVVTVFDLIHSICFFIFFKYSKFTRKKSKLSLLKFLVTYPTFQCFHVISPHVRHFKITI
jgi:hypothetical protein